MAQRSTQGGLGNLAAAGSRPGEHGGCSLAPSLGGICLCLQSASLPATTPSSTRAATACPSGPPRWAALPLLCPFKARRCLLCLDKA